MSVSTGPLIADGPIIALAPVVHRSIGLLSDRVCRGLLFCSSLVLAGYGLVLIGVASQVVRLDALLSAEPG